MSLHVDSAKGMELAMGSGLSRSEFIRPYHLRIKREAILFTGSRNRSERISISGNVKEPINLLCYRLWIRERRGIFAHGIEKTPIIACGWNQAGRRGCRGSSRQ